MKYEITVNGKVLTRTSKENRKWAVVVMHRYDPEPRFASLRFTRRQAHQSAAYHLGATTDEDGTQVAIIPVSGSIEMQPLSRYELRDNRTFHERETGLEIARVEPDPKNFHRGTFVVPSQNVAEPCKSWRYGRQHEQLFRKYFPG